jgi:hypothetical protein
LVYFNFKDISNTQNDILKVLGASNEIKAFFKSDQRVLDLAIEAVRLQHLSPTMPSAEVAETMADSGFDEALSRRNEKMETHTSSAYSNQRKFRKREAILDAEIGSLQNGANFTQTSTSSELSDNDDEYADTDALESEDPPVALMPIDYQPISISLTSDGLDQTLSKQSSTLQTPLSMYGKSLTPTSPSFGGMAGYFDSYFPLVRDVLDITEDTENES